MKFGVRECANITFKATSDRYVAGKKFKAGQPVLYIDTAKTSTLEGASTTVYANGGRGNTRLISWEGEKTLTFTVEDALLSPISFAMLSGAGLFSQGAVQNEVHVHMTTQTTIGGDDATADAAADLKIDLSNALGANETVDTSAPIFIAITEDDGSITGDFLEGTFTASDNVISGIAGPEAGSDVKYVGKSVFVDYYITKSAANVDELQIDAEHFAGYYYVEADTLFRRQSDGVDLPANITLPNVKIQSNFTFAMASTGDPSTFTFTMDAFPGYTIFDKTKKVLCVLQVINPDTNAEISEGNSVMGHQPGEIFG